MLNGLERREGLGRTVRRGLLPLTLVVAVGTAGCGDATPSPSQDSNPSASPIAEPITSTEPRINPESKMEFHEGTGIFAVEKGKIDSIDGSVIYVYVTGMSLVRTIVRQEPMGRVERFTGSIVGFRIGSSTLVLKYDNTRHQNEPPDTLGEGFGSLSSRIKIGDEIPYIQAFVPKRYDEFEVDVIGVENSTALSRLRQESWSFGVVSELTPIFNSDIVHVNPLR